MNEMKEMQDQLLEDVVGGVGNFAEALNRKYCGSCGMILEEYWEICPKCLEPTMLSPEDFAPLAGGLARGK